MPVSLKAVAQPIPDTEYKPTYYRQAHGDQMGFACTLPYPPGKIE